MEHTALITELLARRAARPEGRDTAPALGLSPPIDAAVWGTHFMPTHTWPGRGTTLRMLSPFLYDGLELAALLTNTAPGGSHDVHNDARDPFWKHAARQSPVLLDGPLRPLAVALLDAVIPVDPRDDRAQLLECAAVVLTMGIRLHHRIHGVVAPALADLIDPPTALANPVWPDSTTYASDAAAPFLDQILAAPDDDGPRLVFADWLLQHGDPRGELITAQCHYETARGARRAELDARATVLLAHYAPIWDRAITSFGLFTHPPWTRRYRRGFLTAAEGPLTRFVDHYARFLRYPLQQVDLRDGSANECARLAGLPAHPTLEEISFGNSAIALAPAVFASAFLERIAILKLHTRPPVSVRTLAELRTRRLRRLSLYSNPITADELRTLCMAPCMKTVEELELSSCPAINDTVLDSLAALPRLRVVHAERTAITRAHANRYPSLTINLEDRT